MLMDSPYLPMVKWYELSILGSFALYSILGYHVVMFFRLRASIVNVRPPSWRDNLKTVLGHCSLCAIPAGDIGKLSSPAFSTD